MSSTPRPTATRRRSRPSPIAWPWRVRHAAGFRALGLFAEAKAELEAIAKSDAGRVEVLCEWTALHQEGGEWDAMTRVAASWVKFSQEDAAAWVAWAYGTRRSASLAAAEKILLEALLHHPHNATVHFNLACYACQTGNLSQAQRRVVKAIALDPAYKAVAKIDPDLAPLRDAGMLQP